MVSLDATAGNRHIWGKNWDQPVNRVVFLDIEPRLNRPPHVLADNQHLPFRDNVFKVVFFDPPWIPRILSRHNDPKENKGTYWGTPGRTRRALVRLLIAGLCEFTRVSSRLCTKFGDFEIPRWNYEGLLKSCGWTIIHVKEYRSKAKRNSGKHKTMWLTAVKRRGDIKDGSI